MFTRQLVQDFEGVKYVVWIDPARMKNLDTHDPCCGLSYYGGKYNDEITTCATSAEECGAGTTPVYGDPASDPANDPVCGERQQCVPYPQARVVVDDGTQVVAVDADESPLPQGDAHVAYRPVVVGREGFVTVTIGGSLQQVAMDYGSRYTIVVQRGQIDRVVRD